MREHAIRVFAVVGLAAALFVSRWPLVPASLPNFDSANFAFALDHFNPVTHCPQPPGYPLYVGLTQIIHLFVEDVMHVFAITGIIGTLIALLALAYLTAAIAGPRGAAVAATLLLFHPAAWTAGLLNPVRVFLAAGSAAVAVFAWKCWRPGGRRAWLILAWATLGLAAGFRPTLAILLLPLCLAAGIRRHSKPTDWALAILAFVITTTGWVAACIYPAGGIGPFFRMLQAYMKDQSSSSSPFWGASWQAAAHMAATAITWAAAPAVCWLWVVPLIPRRTLLAVWRATGSFFLIWTLPAVLLYTLVHSAEPGHILPLVVPLCLLGGVVCSHLAGNRWRAAAMVALVGGCNVLLFFRPPLDSLHAASIGTVRHAGQSLSEFRAVVDRLALREPVTVVVARSAPVAWRPVSYYYRDRPVIVLRSYMDANAQPDYWIVRQNNIEAWGPGRVPVACGGKLVWFVGEPASRFVQKGSPVALKRVGPALISDSPANSTFAVAQYTFKTAAGCSPPRTQAGSNN